MASFLLPWARVASGMTEPDDATSGAPPGYSEGPPTEPGSMGRSRTHVDRLDEQNAPVSDAAGIHSAVDDDAPDDEPADGDE